MNNVDSSIIILALETLREQVQDSYTQYKEFEDESRLQRIDEQILNFKK